MKKASDSDGAAQPTAHKHPLNHPVDADRVDSFDARDAEEVYDNFEHIADLLPQIIWAADAEGVVNYVSNQWDEFTGRSPAMSAQYLEWEDIVHPDELEQVRERWLHSVKTGTPYDHEFRLRHKSGVYYWFSSKAIPLRAATGEELRWHGVLTDIETQKRAQKALEESAKQKDDFIALLGHELRNPLAAISTSFETMETGDLVKEEQSEAFEMLRDQIDHLTRLVNDTLDIARLSSGKLILEKKPTNLTEVTRKVVNEFQAVAKAGKIQMHCHTEEGKAWIDADAVRIRQCISNLLHNALKFTPPDGRIDIRVRRDSAGENAIIEVADSGVGICPTEIDQLFEPFTQGSEAAKLAGNGLGLGLSVLSEIVTLHGGKVTARSEGKNRGATFRINLPLIAEPQVAVKKAVLPERSTPKKSMNICLVEDNVSVARSLELFLKIEGHRVTHIRSGQEAIAYTSQNTPDVILSDLTLGDDISGWDIARHVAKTAGDGEKPYLIALSGHTQKSHVEKSLDAGFDEHLAKPPSLDDLRSALVRAAAR